MHPDRLTPPVRPGFITSLTARLAGLMTDPQAERSMWREGLALAWEQVGGMDGPDLARFVQQQEQETQPLWLSFAALPAAVRAEAARAIAAALRGEIT